MRSQFIASEIGIGLRRNLTMTIAVVLVATVSMFFLGAAVIFRSQVNLSKKFWYGEIEMSLYLCAKDSAGPNCTGGEVTQAQRDDILRGLQGNPEVKAVVYESKHEAFQRFKQQFKDSVLSEVVQEDQLQESYRVKLKNPERYDAVASQFQSAQGVERVLDYRKLLQPLFRFMNGALEAALALAIILLATAALLIFNTIRLAAFNRRRETGIMRLVGASSFYIQLPFILEGVVAALLGVLLAFGFLAASYRILVNWLSTHAADFTPYVGFGSVVSALVWMAVVGVSIAALASWLTLRRYLRV